MEGNTKVTSMDIVGLLKLLIDKRKIIVRNCIIGGVLSIVIAFSIPKEYTSTVSVAPEMSSGISGLSGSLGSLASIAGVDLNLGGGEDALYPDLYPQIVSSTPFLCELMGIQVEGEFHREPFTTDLYHYLKSYQKESWWNRILGVPGKMINRMRSTPADAISPTIDLDSRSLSRRQQLLIKSLNKRISVSLDKLTSVINIDVTMQDPKIAADVAQQVSDNIQKYIANYRSAKARKDLEYISQLHSDAQSKYIEAQQNYAIYADQHKGVVKMKYQSELDRLSNEQDLAFNVYNQIASQYEMARAKVQEHTPVCVVIQPPVVPFKASSPKKMLMGILFVFMAFFGTAAWYIIKDRLL